MQDFTFCVRWNKHLDLFGWTITSSLTKHFFHLWVAFNAALFLPLSSAVHDSPPLPYFFQSPPKFTLFCPKCLVVQVSNQGESCCVAVWALGSAFHGEEAFHATECVVDIQWGFILSTQHRDCLLDRQARGGDGGTVSVSSHLLFRPLSALPRCPEPIPPQSIGDKLNMIRYHHTGLESRGKGSGLYTIFDLYGN